nr:hypothetical protein [Sphingomonas sp. Y57]
MWGTTISLSQIKSSDFAVDFMGTASSLSASLAIDSFKVRIYFIPPPADISATITEADDTLQATGLINQPREYSASITEAADTAAATGTVKVKGAATLAEADDTVYARIGYTAVIDWDFTASEVPDPRIVFSGGANGTRVNSAGQIVAASAPRYDYDPVTLEAKGLLNEATSTNLLTQSEFATGLPASRGGLVSAATFSGLIGTTGLAFGYDGATDSYAYTTNFTPVVSTQYYFSVFVRMDDGGAPAFGGASIHSPLNDFVVNIGNAVASPTTYKVEDYGGGLYRVIVPAINNASPGASIGVIKYRDNSPRTFKISGVMYELGFAATSYIATGASQVTRSADIAVVSGVDFSDFYNQSEGTFIVDFDTYMGANSYDRGLVGVDSGSSVNRMIVYMSSSMVGRAIGNTSSSQSFFFSNLGPISPNTHNSIALAYALNDFAASMNGTAPSTSASGTPGTVNRMTIGRASGAEGENGHIRRLRYYDVRVKDSELKALTALQGRAVIVETGDTLAAGGKAYITAALNKIEATDALTATAQVYVKATLNKIEATDALSSAATVRIKGALARTEANDTVSAQAKAYIRATVTIGEAGDALVAAADAGPAAVASERRTIILLGAPLSGRTVELTGSRLADRTIII